MARRKNWDSGNIVEVALPSGGLTYGMVIEAPRVAFFDRKFVTRPTIDEIVEAPIAFQVWVMKYAIGKHWPVIGCADVTSSLLQADRFFKQDAISGKLSIYESAGHETPATYADIAGLERAAVWNPVHIESRLEDYYAGIENIWVKSLAPKKPQADQAAGGNGGQAR